MPAPPSTHPVRHGRRRRRLDGDGVLELLVSHGESKAQPLSLSGRFWAPATTGSYRTDDGVGRYGAARSSASTRRGDAAARHRCGSGYLCQQEPIAHFGLAPRRRWCRSRWCGRVASVPRSMLHCRHAARRRVLSRAHGGRRLRRQGRNLAYADITPVRAPPPRPRPRLRPRPRPRLRLVLGPASPSHPPAPAPGGRPRRRGRRRLLRPCHPSTPPSRRGSKTTGEAAEEVDVVLIVAVPPPPSCASSSRCAARGTASAAPPGSSRAERPRGVERAVVGAGARQVVRVVLVRCCLCGLLRL